MTEPKKSTTKIVTPIGRASFPTLAVAKKYMEGATAKYSLAILLLKSDPKVIAFLPWLKEAVSIAATDKHGAHAKAALANFTNLKDGDQVDAFKTYYAEYAGCWILNMNRNEDLEKPDKNRPRTVNREKVDIAPGEIYAGCNVRAYISVYGYAAGPKKGITISFEHVQKTGENSPFTAGGLAPEDAYSELDLPPEDKYAGVQDVAPTGPAPTGPVETPTADPFKGK